MSEITCYRRCLYVRDQGVLRYPNGFTYDACTNPFCCKTPATTTPEA